QLAARPRAAQAHRTPAQEIARLSSLKAQLEHPLSGHVYDMDVVPPRLQAMHIRSGAGLAHLEPVWNQLKQPGALADLEAQRAVCWLALQCARLLIDQNQTTAARAKLETTLDLVSDDGLRHVVRCELALEAARRRELAAAKGWLAECDPAAEVLELDTCFRVATARVALLENNPARVLEVLGYNPGDIPLDAGWTQHINVVRTHACELLGHIPPVLLTAADLAFANRENLAPRARLGLVEQQVRSLRAEQANAGSIRSTALRTILIAPWWSLLIALATTVVSCAVGSGPVFGVTSDVLCPRIGAGRPAPSTHARYSSNGSDVWAVSCDNAQGLPSKLRLSGEQRSYIIRHDEQNLPGGGWTLLSIAFFAYYPLGTLLAFAFAIRSYSTSRARARARLPELQAAEAKLFQLGGNPNADAVTPRFNLARALPGWLILLLPLLLMGSCAAVNLGLRTQ